MEICDVSNLSEILFTNCSPYGYSPYKNNYYDENLGTFVHSTYDMDKKTENIIESPTTQNNILSDTYNFKVGDKMVNTILSEYYNIYFDYIMNNLNDIKLPKDIAERLSSIKHEYLEPYVVSDNSDDYDLFCSIKYRSKLFSNAVPEYDKTEFVLKEQKNINKKDHAYVTLFFPSYGDNNEKKYGYLIATLLVAYMLKNNCQNYDLYKQELKGTKANVVCMVTEDIDQDIIDILKLYYDDVVIAPYIVWDTKSLPENITNYIKINDVSKGNINTKHAYSKVFTKLNIFDSELFPYKKLILLDTDLFPFGYYDTLFSIDTPAGCLEHRRSQVPEFGISSWGTDRVQFAKHGHSIPKSLTDIENVYASDVNASLLIIEPNKKEFDNMIKELQLPLNEWNKIHKGFWLGNMFYDFYFLPEQNYLTKHFSGQWKSVDLGFSTWVIDINNSFGFTFAGFTVKPWEVQSAFQKYSVNPYSEFSKINNTISQKSYGYQTMNEFLFNMLNDIKIINTDAYDKLKPMINTTIIFRHFDPWEPEFDLNSFKNKKKMSELTLRDLRYLSYDQKKMLLHTNNNISKKILTKVYILILFLMSFFDIYKI